MPNFKKTRGFTLRSGNKPSMSSFKMMGSSPANMRSFGIGEGTSPAPVKDAWADALKKDPDLNKHVAERDKHEKGSAEYEKWQAKINAAHGKVRNQETLKKDQDNLANKEETKEDAEVSTDDDATNIKADGGGGDKASLIGKIGKGAKGVGGALFQGLTHGLDAVYGTGKVNVGNSITVSQPKKKKDDKTGEEKVDEIINKEA
jgi:hypothetical protein